MMMNDPAGIDVEESLFIPIEASESEFDKLREDIIDRMSRGLTPSSVVHEPNPFITFNLKNNPFIKRGVSNKYKNLKPPTEIDKIVDKTTQVIRIPSKLRDDFVDTLDKNIGQIRDFLILQIAPLVIGFDTASDESVQMLRLITHDDKLTLNTRKVQELFRELMVIKLSKYLSNLLEIDDAIYDKLLDAYLVKYMSPTQKPSSSSDILNKLAEISARQTQTKQTQTNEQ